MTSARALVSPDRELVPVASAGYVGELDGIRAVAVSLVVVAHYGLGFIVPGAFGVTLFFFLSGYLITTLFFAEYAAATAISVRRFYLRRWLRLTPPLLVFILLATVFHSVSRTSVGGDAVPVGTTLAALLYYTNYYDLFWNIAADKIIPFGICWSLAVEEHFYLLWPWVLRAGIRHTRSVFWAIVAVCAAVLAWRLIARYGLGLSSDYTYMATECRIDSILYGALLRLLFETQWAPAVVRFLRTPTCRIVAGLLLLATFVIRDEGFRQTVRYSIQGIALMPIFTAVLVDDPRSLLRRVLSSAPAVLLGRLSYSIYLLHLLARTPGEVVFGGPYRAGSIISGLLFVLTAAYLIHVLIERPMARLRRRLHEHADAGRPIGAALSRVTGNQQAYGSASIGIVTGDQ